METVQEQVLPFEGPQGINEDVQFKGPDVPTEQEAAHSPSHHAESPSHHKKHNKHHNANMPAPHQSSTWQADNTTPVMPPDRLANFYRRYNKILLDNVAISKEKERLSLENAQLQDLIQQYIQGTQLSDETLANDNPLFVVNGRLVYCCPYVLLFDVVIHATSLSLTLNRPRLLIYAPDCHHLHSNFDCFVDIAEPI